MIRPLLTAAGLVLTFGLVLCACSAASTTTTTTTESAAETSTTAKTRVTTAPASSTTSTTQPVVVWQTVRYEQNNPGIEYSGDWTRSSAEAASEGSFVHSDSEGAALSFHFVGSHCSWLAKTSDQYGKATISVDDGSASTVDLYSKDTTYCHVVWEAKSLPFGDHTVKIEWSGKKKKASKGTSVNLDAIEIVGALVGRYQQSNSHLDYAGRWKTVKDDDAAGGSFILTKSSKASVTVSFTGIQIDWYAKQGPAYGKAQVIVDDGDPVTIDLYGGDELWDQNVWSSGRLEMGPHVVEIRWTGAKDPASTGTYINVDEFEITGALE